MDVKSNRSSLLKRMVSMRNVFGIWLPFVASLLILFSRVFTVNSWHFIWWAKLAPYLFYGLLGYLGVFVLVRLFQRRWGSAVVSFLCLTISWLAIYPVATMIFFVAFYGPSEDGFADNLTVPVGVAYASPQVWPSDANRANDRYQKAVLDSLKIESADEVGFVADCENLVAANQVSRKRFERHLATHPGWRVFTENGKRFATRRWAIEHAWKYSLHGYYTDHDRPSEIDFQTRLTIGLSGVPWARNLNRATTSEIGEFVEPASSFRNDRYLSHLVLSADDLAIEIFEESPSKERVMTKAALAFLNDEFLPLANADDWSAVHAAMKPSSVQKGEPAIEIYESYQPGIYDACVWINPGEAGMVYLKAFEVTREYSLSEPRLKKRTNEWVGWSKDPQEQFFSNTHFTIFEGDWDQPYLARFEVWFEPDSGQPARKLLEKVFKIEGWMR